MDSFINQKPTVITMKSLIILLFSICLFSCNTEPEHNYCSDATHELCSQYCSCAGTQCEFSTPIIQSYAIQRIPSRDYQVEIVEDSLLFYDGNRFIGTIPIKDSAISTLIYEDNH